MAVDTSFYKSFMSEEIRDEGRAQGRAQGQAEAQAKSLLLILDARSIALTDELRQKITACTDSPLLNQWLQRAATATTADEVFTADR